MSVGVSCIGDGSPSTIDPARLQTATRRLSDEEDRHNNQAYNYLLDIAISQSDVERRRAELQSARPPQLPPNAHFAGGGFIHAEAAFELAGDEQRREAVHKMAPIPQFDASSVVRQPMTEVLKARRQWLAHRQTFAMQQLRMPFLDALLASSMVALVAEPGTGRTLQLPILLAETDAFKRKRIILVTANAVAAQLTVRRLREERGENVDTSRTVAAVLPSQVEATKGTVIVVTTAEVLVRQLLCDPTLVDVGCVIFDDAHLRQETTELCFALLRESMEASAAIMQRRGDATAAKSARVVVSCPDDACAAPILRFFQGDASAVRVAQAGVRTTTFSVAAALAAGAVAMKEPAVLYVEETIQWLAKCGKEGSSLCRDPEGELASYVESVDVVARTVEATESDFNQPHHFRNYWSSLAVQSVAHYDAADLAARGAGSNEVLPAVVLVAPTPHLVRCLEESVRRTLSDGFATEHFILSSLCEGRTPVEAFLQVAQGAVLSKKSQRSIIITTPELAQTVLPSNLSIGLVVDMARSSWLHMDPSTAANCWTTEYASVDALRYRRHMGGCHPSGLHGAPRMVIQLIPRSVLHSPQHRRLSTEPSQHIIFRLSVERYVSLYHFLQAHEEAGRCKQTSVADSEENKPQSVAAKTAVLLSSNFVGVPNATATKYEQVRRVFASVESHLLAAGHIELARIDAPRPPTAGGAMRLQPMGMFACCVPLPMPVARLLLVSSIFQCSVEATAVAALWLVGDVFLHDEDDGATHNQGTENEEDGGEPFSPEEMQHEARLFFSLNSNSDVVCSLNVYLMWLKMRSSGSAADEDSFLEQGGLSRRVLLQVERTHHQLFAALVHHGLVESIAHSEIPSVVRAHMTGLSDDYATRDDRLSGCISVALYPNCAVLEDGGAARLVDSLSGGGAGMRRNTQVGLFCDQSVLRSPAPTIVGRPLLVYGKRTTGQRAGTAASNSLVILGGGSPLLEVASIVFGGVSQERLKPVPRRCRGWCPVLTDAWRQTKLARRLPPKAQLPTPSIALQPYDTIGSPQVVVRMDYSLSYTLRSTVSRWLGQLRDHILLHTQALIQSKEWNAAGAHDSSNSITDAWSWLSRRSRESHAWLREERAARAHGAEGADEKKTRLYPYYEFNLEAGLPRPVEAPVASSTQGGTAEANPSGGVEQDAPSEPAVFTGKMPSPSVQSIIANCVNGVAKKRTREAEGQLLRDNPEMFYFLDPENEYHAFYLHLLHKAMPDMEILGDNIDDLLTFLQQLEVELRGELGIPLESTDAQAPAKAAAPMEADEEVGWGHVEEGLQMETTAVQLQRPAEPTLARATKTINIELPVETQVAADPPSMFSDPIPGPGENGAPLSFTESGSGTLMERLMAMKNGSMAGDMSAPTPSAADLRATLNAAGAPPTEGAPPTAAELMALLAPPPMAAVEDPLLRPPPPLPKQAVDARPPSVLVYPLPTKGNVPLSLAKALGETMDVRVGPTTVVGRIARIDVPHRKVEMRALALKSFMCLGERVFIFKNDRIVDNPEAAVEVKQQIPRGGARSRAMEAPREVLNFGYPVMPPPPPIMNVEGFSHPPVPSHVKPPAQPSRTPAQIGVFSDSDDDDDDDSASNSSSNSSEGPE